MYFLHSDSSDPHFNLALEEHLFEQSEAEFFILYRNESSVVMGKHQNAVAEVNVPFVVENNIPYLRRFSGGGTVYHDLENINFSFITQGEDTKVIEFDRFANPVIAFLKSQGLNATLSDRKDILVNGKKISGHAAHAKNKRALHHGTLLFNADLETLSACLRSNKEKFKSRAVKSVPSPVCNVKPLLDQTIEVDSFIEAMGKFMVRAFKIEGTYALSASDRSKIRDLISSKYRTWAWNAAYGPEYTFSIEQSLFDLDLQASFLVQKGQFVDVECRNEESVLFASLKGLNHDYNLLLKNLKPLWGEKTIDLVKLLF